MDIVICTDNNYVMPAGVLICSICENNVTEKIRFHIIVDDAFLEENRQSLFEEVLRYNQEICFHHIDKNLYSSFPIGLKGQLRHLTFAAYYRLFLGRILPPSIKKVLYLDCDIIVRHNLAELWNTDIEEYAVGCIADQGEGSIIFYNRLRYPQHLGYFNSGVLLINLDYWRNYNLLEEFLDFLKKYPERALTFDQDVLNYVLRHRKKCLPLKYNVQSGFLCNELNISWEYEKELEEAINSPCIIHYIDIMKPWIKGCDHPYKSEFFKYRQLTKWRNYPLQKLRIKFTKKEQLKRFLSRFGIMTKVGYNYRNDLKLVD